MVFMPKFEVKSEEDFVEGIRLDLAKEVGLDVSLSGDLAIVVKIFAKSLHEQQLKFLTQLEKLNE
jgi:hypothetical protein